MFSKLQTNNDLVKKDGGVVFGTDDATGAVTVRFSKADYSNHTAATGIGSAIDHLDKMIAAVDGMRANLGAIQNHFPVISSPHKTSSKPDILAVLNSFERMATFRWFFCA